MDNVKERINKAKIVSRFTKNLIIWDGGYYVNCKAYKYFVIRFYLMIFKIKIPILEVHDNIINTLKHSIKLIPLNLRYLFYAKIENNKRIKEYHKAINKLNNKQILFN